MTGEPAGVGDETGPTSALPRVLRIFGTIIAPTTLLTAVCYYFGWMFSYWFFDYFGVNSTLLGLAPSDYLIRAVDGLFVPMTVLGCISLLALWGHVLLRTYIAGPRIHLLRVLVPLIAVVGLVLAFAGLASVFTTTVLTRHLAAAPISLAVGVLLLEYAVTLRRTHNTTAWTAVAEWAALFVLVGVSLFWAATDYAGAVGRTRAYQFARELPTYPETILYSRQSLSLRMPGVQEMRCQAVDAAYRFRYDGLKLVLQSGGQYLLLPEQWTPADGAAVLLPRDNSLRLEFTRAGAPTPKAC